MNLRKTLLAVIVASSFGAVALPAQSEIVVRIAPPVDRVEVVPAPRRGYVWEPGHWQWNGHRHVWRAGHWERARTGYVYNAPRWTERDGRWHYEARRWDRDHDGISDRHDRDRDGDGVPNNRDRRPDNPHRS